MVHVVTTGLYKVKTNFVFQPSSGFFQKHYLPQKLHDGTYKMHVWIFSNTVDTEGEDLRVFNKRERYAEGLSATSNA